MPVTDVTQDLDTRTLTITAEFAAPVERVWQVYADPRQLEQVFGPPTYPATFVEHDLTPGGKAHYYMTSPEGERYPGGWRVLGVDPPNRLDFEDYFADESGDVNADLPISRSTVTFEETSSGRTRMTIVTRYEDAAAMEKVLEMGMEQGISLALGQIGALLAET